MMEQYNINQTTLKIIGLYRNDYRRSLHLRRISRGTGVDVKSIQLQLKKLERMRILTSTIKGRNKEYSLDLNNLLTKYHMILAETFATISYLGRNFLVKKIASELQGRMEGTIILFGSFAKERTTKESDVDLFILTEEETDVYARVASEVEELISRDINIKSASKTEFLRGFERGDPLMREVVSEHIVLKGIEDFCDVMWRSHAW